MSFPGQSLQRAWHLVDAKNQTVGRLAGQISQILKVSFERADPILRYINLLRRHCNPRSLLYCIGGRKFEFDDNSQRCIRTVVPN